MKEAPLAVQLEVEMHVPAAPPDVAHGAGGGGTQHWTVAGPAQ